MVWVLALKTVLFRVDGDDVSPQHLSFYVLDSAPDELLPVGCFTLVPSQKRPQAFKVLNSAFFNVFETSRQAWTLALFLPCVSLRQ